MINVDWNKVPGAMGAENKYIDLITHIIVEDGIPFTISKEGKMLGNASFMVEGFKSPDYPGIVPEHLFAIQIFPGDDNMKAYQRFKQIYKLATNKRNIEMLDWLNIEHPITKYDAFDYWWWS